MKNREAVIISLIVMCLLIVSDTIAGTPVISNLSDKAILEGSVAAIYDGDVSFSGGTSYVDGFVRFSLAGSGANDQFTLTNDADVNASGAISLVGTDVYLGNGSGRDRIGSIDATENGQNGQPLKILFAIPLVNAGFETGDLTGWTYYDQQFTGNSQGQAIPYSYSCSPTCTTGTGTLNFPSGISPADSSAYNYELSTATVYSGTYSLRLYLSGNVTDEYSSANTGLSGTQPTGYASWHGPYVESTSFEAENGDSISMEWSAQNGGDWYEVFGYLVGSGGDGTFGNGNDTSTLLFSQRGDSQSWITSNSNITSTDTYIFRFVGGTYDASGGLAVGGSLYLDNFRIIGSTAVNDSVVTSTVRNVAYQNTGAFTATRTLTVDAQAQDGSTGSDTASLTVMATEPTTAASAIDFTLVGTAGLTVNWTNGNGTDRLVLVKSGSAVDASPADGTEYIAGTAFGSGSEIGIGNYVVYAGTGNSVSVTGLTAGTTYHTAVYEFNGLVTGVQNYLLTAPPTLSIDVMNPPGNSIELSGSNHMDLGTIDALTSASAFTIEAWVKLSALGDFDPIFSRGSGTSAIYMKMGGAGAGGSNDIVVGLGDGSDSYGYTVADLLNAGTWNHCAMVFDGAQSGNDARLKFYFNGVEQPLTFSGTIPTTSSAAVSALLIGSEDGLGNYLSGTMDEARVWSTARTAAQIRAAMNNYFDGDETGLAAYYRFDHLSGTTLFDLTADDNDGTLVGGGSWSASSSFNVWTGSVDTTWNLADNWSNGVPGSSSNAGIPSGGNQPTISGGAASCNHLVVESGATLAIDAGNTLTVTGNVYAPGTIAGDGTVASTGSKIQTVEIASAGGLTVDNTSGFNLTSDLTLSGGLTLSNGAVLDIRSNTVTVGSASDIAPDATINVTLGTTTGVITDGDSNTTITLQDNCTIDVTLGPGYSYTTSYTIVDATGGTLTANPATFNYTGGGGWTGKGEIAGQTLVLSAVPPTVTTQAATGISTTAATGNGIITHLGSDYPIQHGVCWNTTGTPTTADSKTEDGAVAVTGAFTSFMTGLAENTSYYVRAYATNSVGTVYGTQVSFTTPPPIQRTLTIYKSGAGDGTVTSSPAGVNCGIDCVEQYDDSTSVSLTATANAASIFTGWSGASDDTYASTAVVMTADRSCTANFTLDTDGDGMSDDWEQTYGLNLNIDDADEDLDGDGATNLEEYLAGTDPTDPDSRPNSIVTPILMLLFEE